MTTRVDRADLASAEHIFEAWLGFDIHGAAPRRLQDFLAARSAQLGYSTVREYLDALPRHRPSTAEAQRLVNMLTNGLTAFWRDPPQLEALASVLAQIDQRSARPLNVWCAGCATGEEAYSIAIAARERGVDVRVLGTDVNTSYLDEARRGDFDAWALRRLSDERRQRWFQERDGRWALDRDIAACVEFRHHNLLDPAPTPHGGRWDAILCRNVIIYLTDDAISRILLQFADVIDDDGYLLLGSSERIGEGLPGFRATQHGPAFVYRAESTLPGDSLPLSLPLFEASSLEEETAGFTDEDAVSQLLSSAVSQDHETAIACCEAASGYDPFATEVYALLGLFMLEFGAPERAAQAFAKVLFLDPDNWWAAIRRAEICEELGDLVEAHRYYRLALEGLAMRPGAPFDPAMSVGPLRSVAASRDDERNKAALALDRLASGRG